MSCITFPRPLKRGPKVRRGPCAEIVAFPPQLRGDALRARWAWLFHHAVHWTHEEVNGTYTESRDWEAPVRLSGPLAAQFRGEHFNEAYMHREIDRLAEHIRKRARLKEWLKELGIGRRECQSAETALFFVFDLLRVSSGSRELTETKEGKLLRMLEERIAATRPRQPARQALTEDTADGGDDGPDAA